MGADPLPVHPVLVAQRTWLVLNQRTSFWELCNTHHNKTTGTTGGLWRTGGTARDTFPNHSMAANASKKQESSRLRNLPSSLNSSTLSHIPHRMSGPNRKLKECKRTPPRARSQHGHNWENRTDTNKKIVSTNRRTEILFHKNRPLFTPRKALHHHNKNAPRWPQRPTRREHVHHRLPIKTACLQSSDENKDPTRS